MYHIEDKIYVYILPYIVFVLFICMFVFLYSTALLNPVVILSSTTTTSVTLTLSQPTNSLPENQYTATLTSSTCSGIPTRIETTTTDSVMISNIEEGIQYTVNVTATNTKTGLTSYATTTVTTQEESMYIFIY